MKYHVNKLLLCIIALCFTAATLSAGESTVYKNEELGFSLSYPKEWSIQEIELGIILSSIPDFFDFKEQGVGIALFISPVADMALEKIPQSNLDVWEALKGNNDTIEEKSIKNIEWQGRQWLVAEFYEKGDDCDAVFYLLIDNDLVYVIGCIYHPPVAKEEYKDIIEEIVQSIRFSKL